MQEKIYPSIPLQAANGPGPSGAVFGKMATLQLEQDPNLGIHDRDHFLHFNAINSTAVGAITEGRNGYNLFVSGNGSIVDAGISLASAIKLQAAAVDNDAVVIHAPQGVYRISRGSGRPVAFEVRMQTSSIAASSHGFFVGLTSIYTPTAILPITDAGALADKDLIGFQKFETPGNVVGAVFKAAGQTAGIAGNTPLSSANGWIKFGFFFDGDQTLTFYKDGTKISNMTLQGSQLGNATFPANVSLGPIIALKNATGTSPGNISIDFRECSMKFAPGD